jgi:hypothetical protein
VLGLTIVQKTKIIERLHVGLDGGGICPDQICANTYVHYLRMACVRFNFLPCSESSVVVDN